MKQYNFIGYFKYTIKDGVIHRSILTMAGVNCLFKQKYRPELIENLIGKELFIYRMLK